MIAGLIQLIGLRRLSPIQLYAIGSGTAALLTFAMWKVGRAYSAALIDALRAGRPQVFPTVVDDAPFNGRQVDAAAVAAVIAGASDEDVRVRRAAVEILGDLPDREAARCLADRRPGPRRDGTGNRPSIARPSRRRWGRFRRVGGAGRPGAGGTSRRDPRRRDLARTAPPARRTRSAACWQTRMPAVRATAASAILRGTAPRRRARRAASDAGDRRSAGSRAGAGSARRIGDRR